jgi:hypothetical protein
MHYSTPDSSYPTKYFDWLIHRILIKDFELAQEQRLDDEATQA